MSEVQPHVPVLLPEVLAALAPATGERHVDGTFGAGGYARALLDAGAEVVAFDRDPDALAAGREMEAAAGGKLKLVAGRYSEMADHVDAADGVALDLGVSSMQLDRAERGFSYSADGPLDMRMERSGTSAAEFLNGADEHQQEDEREARQPDPDALAVAVHGVNLTPQRLRRA